jgi:ABC-2 type transport system permease protein
VSTGIIHDLGYKRYLGTRRPQSTRWRVIVRNQIASAWKTWWRFKMPLGWAVLAMVVGGGFLYIARFVLDFTHGMPGRWHGILGDPLDGIPPLVAPWLCRAGFLFSLTVASGTIAADKQVGAFTFYFARPVRPIDYVLGKAGGIFVMQLILIAAPLFALTAFRVGLSRDTTEMLDSLPLLGAALGTGLAGALVYTAVPVGLSSLVRRRGHAIALWGAYYILFASMMVGIGIAAKTPELGMFDPLTVVESIDQHLFHAHLLPGLLGRTMPLVPAIIGAIGLTAGGLALAWSNVSSEAHAGVGGS